MPLEAIVLEKRESSKLSIDGRIFTFVRGFEDTDSNSISIILEESIFGFRRRYSVHTDSEYFYRIVSQNAPLETFLSPYFGHLIFGSMDIEDLFYENLNKRLGEGSMLPEE